MFRGWGHLRMFPSGELIKEEGGCGRRGTHWTSLSLVYSTQTFVYINTCCVHGVVHNNDM